MSFISSRLVIYGNKSMQKLITVCLMAILANGIEASKVSRRFIFSSGAGTFPCIPSQSRCSLSCTNGYMMGPAGCYYCACATASQLGQHSGPGGMYLQTGGSQPGGNPAGNPQTQQQFAHAQCLQSAADCQCKAVLFHIGLPCYYCDCSNTTMQVSPTPTTSQIVTTSKATSQTTSSSMSSSAAAQVTEPSVVVLTTNMAPSQTTSADYCAVATQLCKLSCPNGYLVDSTDCTYCVCKSDVMKG